MRQKYNKIISILIIIALCILGLISTAWANMQLAREAKLPAGTYILVSFSINDKSLHQYWEEAQKYGATLVIRGLVGKKTTLNRFVATRDRAARAKINVDINPTLFQELNIREVPAIAVIADDGSAKVVFGHITLTKALETMKEKDHK